MAMGHLHKGVSVMKGGRDAIGKDPSRAAQCISNYGLQHTPVIFPGEFGCFSAMSQSSSPCSSGVLRTFLEE